MKRHLLTMFAKAPIPGQVKTRLQPPLTPEQAASLHACFVLDQAERLLTGRDLPEVQGRVSAAGDRSHAVFAEIAALGVEIVEQRGGGLGDRMATAIEEGLAAGFDTVILIGSDSPTLPTALVRDALAALEDRDFVLAPSFDGGYVLIGARKALPELRGPIAYSTRRTLVETLRALREDGKHLGTLVGFWYDVDEASDLEFLAQHLLGALADEAHGLAPRTCRWLGAQGFGAT